jgi:hypothetical protein
MSQEKRVIDFLNQKSRQNIENDDTPIVQSYSYSEYKNHKNPEDYIQHEIDAQIEEYYTLTSLEDLFPFVIIDVNDFTFELVFELKNRLDQAKTESHQSNNSATIQKYENWISILKYIDGFITPQELDVLDKCISTYASVCYPYERRKEIRRNLWYQNSCFDIDLLEFESKIYRIDVQILYELTEILLELGNLFFCTTNSDNNLHSSSGKYDWPISTLYYCWEVFDFDCIHLYEMEYEITAANYGLIKDIWNSDHVIPYRDSISGNHIEYDYCINQFIDNAQEEVDKIDIGDFDCLTEDDLFKDTWLVDGLKLPNHIDYFWEAEITDYCQNNSRDFYTNYRDGFSEHEYYNYSKYLCYQGDSGFYYCNKESCEGCTRKHSCTEKVVNKQYILWQKYVQPLKSDEYTGPKAY